MAEFDVAKSAHTYTTFADAITAWIADTNPGSVKCYDSETYAETLTLPTAVQVPTIYSGRGYITVDTG